MLKAIQKELKTHAAASTLASHQKFIPGLEKGYGVAMPVLNKMAGTYKSGGFELVKALWQGNYIEEKILAAKILGKIAKQDASQSLHLFEWMSATITNWAVCDALGMQSLKPLVKTQVAAIFKLAKKLNAADNFWQRRLSLVVVEWYTRDKQYHAQIMQLVTALKNDQEYYVKKAIAWILRNIEKGG
ncbi:MAG: DNA alkylation repair protein [Sphingobacteriales bacterium]|nr:MAG: DNA alkylation repair protein [Sphingobacteriales bacterium]